MWPISTTSTCWKNIVCDKISNGMYFSTNCNFFNQIDKRCIQIMCDYTYLFFKYDLSVKVQYENIHVEHW